MNHSASSHGSGGSGAGHGHAHQPVSPEAQACIENCQLCHAVCLSELSRHCLEVGGAHVDPVHFRTMMDCAQICATSADFMLRGSDLHAHVCAACAAICEACAASCEATEGMEECARVCRQCAGSCAKMAAMAA
jgi:hypothetical protein